MKDPIIVCTPIAKNYKKNGPDSKRDYDEQLKRSRNGLRVLWDDSPANRARWGDIFAFIHNGYHVTFHRIEGYSLPTERLPSWSDNVGQGNRNVVYLSFETVTLPWDQWLELGGWKKAQGTQTMMNPTKLLAFLEGKLRIEI
jgi:hypothetical protein